MGDNEGGALINPVGILIIRLLIFTIQNKINEKTITSLKVMAIAEKPWILN